MDAGASVGEVTHDFDGGARPSGSAHDLGAFEHGATSTARGSGGSGWNGPRDAVAGTGGSPASGVHGDGTGAVGLREEQSATGGAPTADSDGGDDGGCGCRTAGGRPVPRWWLAVGAAALALLGGSRRRQAAPHLACRTPASTYRRGAQGDAYVVPLPTREQTRVLERLGLTRLVDQREVRLALRSRWFSSRSTRRLRGGSRATQTAGGQPAVCGEPGRRTRPRMKRRSPR